MFEKVSQAAEQVATRASRREFLGDWGAARWPPPPLWAESWLCLPSVKRDGRPGAAAAGDRSTVRTRSWVTPVTPITSPVVANTTRVTSHLRTPARVSSAVAKTDTDDDDGHQSTNSPRLGWSSAK